MKAIMMSIKPKYVVKILNGEKTIEIRKKFPKDYVGWVYIYCTKEDSLGRIKDIPHDRYFVDCVDTPQDFEKMDSGYDGKGKVVAKYWVERVQENHILPSERLLPFNYNVEILLDQLCLTKEEVMAYGNGEDYYARLIFITRLEIFDKPKEISEFSIKVFPNRKDNLMTRYLTRAPQSWCYIEI